MRRFVIGKLSFWLIALVLRAWGRRLISTDRARSINTAIMAWTIRALGGAIPSNERRS